MWICSCFISEICLVFFLVFFYIYKYNAVSWKACLGLMTVLRFCIVSLVCVLKCYTVFLYNINVRLNLRRCTGSCHFKGYKSTVVVVSALLSCFTVCVWYRNHSMTLRTCSLVLYHLFPSGIYPIIVGFFLFVFVPPSCFRVIRFFFI